MNYKIAIGIVICLVFSCLVISFCILLSRLYIKKVKENNTRKLDFQKTLNQTIIETQEQVLNNISQDLHDDAGQQLTYINFQLENLKLDSPELDKMLEPLSESVGQLSHSIRGISHALNNQLLLQQDLFKAIETEVVRLQKNAKIKIHFLHDAAIEKVFTVNEKIIIYRIFQETINNILKHAKAKEITISTTFQSKFSLVIQDNGKGFDLKTALLGKQTLGLQSISSRAEIINYSVQIQSQIGEGTTITLSENTTT